MGESDKLPDPGPGTYALRHPRRATSTAFLDGGAARRAGRPRAARLGLGAWASTGPSRHPDQVRGIAFTEAIVNPFTWADWPEAPGGSSAACAASDGEAAGARQERVRRADPAGVGARGLTAEAHGALPAAVPRAARTAGRRWTGRGRSRSRTSRRRRTTWSTPTAGGCAAATSRSCSSNADPGVDPGRPAARGRPPLAGAHRGDRAGRALRPRGLPRTRSGGAGRLDPDAGLSRSSRVRAG